MNYKFYDSKSRLFHELPVIAKNRKETGGRPIFILKAMYKMVPLYAVVTQKLYDQCELPLGFLNEFFTTKAI